MSEDCIFCRIVRDKLPAWKIYEDEMALGFLDTVPCTEGHCVIIPKRHVRFWYELEKEETAGLFNAARRVAARIKQVYEPDFVCIFVRGGRVKHAHVVLFQSREGDKLSGFPQSVLGKAEVDFAKVQNELRIE